jgi:hypothetical protein
MTIDFNCTSCGTYLKANDHLVGRVLRCYKCGGLFTVPKESTVTAPARAVAAPLPAPTAPPPAPATAAPPPMPAAAPVPPPIAASAAPPSPALPTPLTPMDFELPPDLALDDAFAPAAPLPATDDMAPVEDVLLLEEEPKAEAPAGAAGAEDFDPADILLLEEEPPKKDKKK